jgi:hypothetical protein
MLFACGQSSNKKHNIGHLHKNRGNNSINDYQKRSNIMASPGPNVIISALGRDIEE